MRKPKLDSELGSDRSRSNIVKTGTRAPAELFYIDRHADWFAVDMFEIEKGIQQ